MLQIVSLQRSRRHFLLPVELLPRPHPRQQQQPGRDQTRRPRTSEVFITLYNNTL